MSVLEELSLGDLAGDLAAEMPDLPFKVPDTRFTGILGDHFEHRLIGYFDMLFGDPVLLQLPGDQVTLRDPELFLFRVP